MTAELRRCVCAPFLEKDGGEEEGSTPRQGRRSCSYGISIIIVLTPVSHSHPGQLAPFSQANLKTQGEEVLSFLFYTEGDRG